MRALIFAAGKGERLRPLTQHTPKPLLDIGQGRRLIEHHLERLAASGIRDVVINTSWLAEQFPPALGDGARWGLRIVYSYEGSEPLETGGGMRNALPLLGDAPFLLVNGDVFTDIDFANLPRDPVGLAHLVMVANPPQHPGGDFVLDANGVLHEGDVSIDGGSRLTYSGIGVFRPALVARATPRTDTPATTNNHRFRLAPLLVDAMRHRQITGQRHAGTWVDVGTPDRLERLRAAPGC